MNKKIFITREIPEKGLNMLRAKGYEVDVFHKNESIGKKRLIQALKRKNYDAVLCLLTDHIDADIFDSAPTVKLYANYATGFDNIDVSSAFARGITITNAPTEASCEAVAEHAIALMLALANKIVEADDFVRQKKYKGWSPMNFVGTNIFGKTFGLIGAGRIGERTAHYAKALGLEIIYSDTRVNDRLESLYGARRVASVEELLGSADVVSIHVPLLPSTRHLIGEAEFRKMKPTAFLINTSRGPVIDEKALVRALQEKQIAGAGLDVFEFEPKLAPGLSRLKNVILTPHIASASIEAREEMAERSAKAIIDFFDGRVPETIVQK